MSVLIINYGIGNLRSIQKMFERVGVRADISGDPEAIKRYHKIVLPGVGHFGAAISAFRRSGFSDLVIEFAKRRDGVLLGICVGAQMLMTSSEEGNEKGLDLIPGQVVKFRFNGEGNTPKIPHMGWQNIRVRRGSQLFEKDDRARFYFTHSYHFAPDDQNDVLASANHGYEFAAAIGRHHVFGVQFHPEKSHLYGMEFLDRFSRL